MRATAAVLGVTAALAFGTAATVATKGPYDPSLDGVQQLRQASRSVAGTNRRILVTVGGNW